MNELPTAPLDQAAFQRVWRRVMPQDRPDCPFTLEPSLPALLPAQAPLPPAPLSGQSVPCLGEASRGELPAIKERMDAAARSRRAYRALERRMGRRGPFSSLASAKARQERRLAAAYFLISGQDYAPAPEAPAIPKTLPLALRERFRAEQMEAAALMEAAQATADPCLSQLYRELAEEDREHTDLLRRHLEQL